MTPADQTSISGPEYSLLSTRPAPEPLSGPVHTFPAVPCQDYSLARDDFRGGIIRTPATRLEKVAIRHQIRQAKVADLDVVVAIKEEAVTSVLPR